MKGKKHSLVTLTKMSAKHKGRKQTPEWIAKRAATLGDGRLKAGWTPERRYAQAARFARQPRRSSALERTVAAVLDLLGEPYEAQKRIGRYAVDFYLPDRDLIVECDGEYWHRDKTRDDLRDANLRESGYHHIVHIPGKAIVKDARAALEAAWRQ
jgi:very-short-patch-repair endonuclease